MDLRAKITEAVCALQGLDHHPSEDDEQRIADAVTELAEARVRELEEENQRLRDAMDHIDAASREDWGGPDHEDVFTQWREAMARARDIAKEDT